MELGEEFSEGGSKIQKLPKELASFYGRQFGPAGISASDPIPDEFVYPAPIPAGHHNQL
jgi:hypothetical protein